VSTKFEYFQSGFASHVMRDTIDANTIVQAAFHDGKSTVGIIDVMPSKIPEGYTADYAIIHAARASFGLELKGVVDDENLLRYLFRHKHSTPFEMCEVKFVMDMPIFVARQFIRHRTACLTGDNVLHFDLPGGVRRRGNQKYRLTVSQVWERFQPTKGLQGNPDFKKTRVQNMCLRSVDEDRLETSHTRIVDIWKTGEKEVFKVTLANGSSCTMSKDHLCFTSSGWKKLCDVATLPGKTKSEWRCKEKFATVSHNRGSEVPQFCPEYTDREVWKNVVGWEDYYEVSSHGNVRRKAQSRVKGVPRGNSCKQRTLSNGRFVVSLSRNAKCVAKHVHVLVAEAFLGPRKDGYECCHNDGNALNCHPSNLRWGSTKSNAEDRVKHGATTKLSVVFYDVSDIQYAGVQPTFDIEVSGPYHNFVAGGMVVHNSVNEYSARYSILSEKFYLPEGVHVRAQSKTNKQGRDGELPDEVVERFTTWLRQISQDSYDRYEEFTKDGVARELTRMGLPINVYTRWVWKCDLHNILNFLRLRRSAHAQQEIRDFADAMYTLRKPIFPWTFEAYAEYVDGAMTFSRTELRLLADVLSGKTVDVEDHFRTKREREEFLDKYHRFTSKAKP